MSDRVAKIAAPVILSLGLAASACILANAARDFKSHDRYVTVKGLVEREVRADLGQWTLKFRSSGNDLAAVQREASAQKDKVMDFLAEAGLGADEVSVVSLRVIDRKAQEYASQTAPDAARFIIETVLLARTSDVDKLVAASQRTASLISQGVILSDDNTCSPGPDYAFTKLNDIKPAMLAEATKNAREAAAQFANDSGSKVGAIRRASQGVFSIGARDRVSENSDGGYGCAPSSPDKKVRLVTTVDYFLAE